VDDVGDLPSQMLAEIQHFFEVYKMLEPDKHSTTREFGGVDEAWAEIEAAWERYKA
jgi:inorganic pyrophosphatase